MFMNVLIGCECSQVVCNEFRKLGHNAFSCDIQDEYGGHPEWHIKSDVLPLLKGECKFITSDGKSHKILSHWDLIIIHPPCTYLSKAGANHLIRYDSNGNKCINRDRELKMHEAADFFYSIIRLVPKETKLCIENPMFLKMSGLPIRKTSGF